MTTTKALPDCCAHTLERYGASCLFGCGTVIGDDGMCHRCGDHSANAFACETCAREWERWYDTWEEA